MSSTAELFALALQLHRAGNLRQAEQLYRQVLQANPLYADAHHLTGIVAYQLGHFNEAVAAISRALDLNSSVAPYYLNLGLAHEALGHLEEAAAAYRLALRLNPDLADAHNNLGNVLQQQGILPEALAHCRQALRLRAEFPEASNNLGNVLLGLGHLQEAVECFQQAVRINPGFAKAFNNLGNALKRQDKVDEALSCYRQAVRLNPHYAEAHYNLGITLARQGLSEEAIQSFQAALRLNPDFAEASNNLGIVLQSQDKPDQASECYQQAIRANPHYAEAWTNLGNVHWEEARFDQALDRYGQALRLRPEMAEAHFNRARLWLLQGNLEAGWPEYEWRWRTEGFPRPGYLQPRWDGSDLHGRTVLLYAEQGLGDTLQFIRYVPGVKQRGGEVIVLCQAPLVRLLTGMPGIDRLAAAAPSLPAFDVQAPLMSLPGIMGTSLDTVPGTVPYLHADSALVDFWRRELDPLGGFKIGIAWQGNPAFLGDRRRSIPLALFAPLAQVEGVRLISLQKGAGADQLVGLDGRFSVLELGSTMDEASGPFVDTAAVMKNLDLVICSDSAVAHLAGALAIPVWVALPVVPDWRWLMQREQSAWYPTMRLFRQTQVWQWEDVFARMAEELRHFL